MKNTVSTYEQKGKQLIRISDIEFDFLHGRYIAVNQANDIIFIMKKWSSGYKGDSEYPGNAIPLYRGTKLYIKKEYIGTLEQQFGTLMMKTYVQTYTQDY